MPPRIIHDVSELKGLLGQEVGVSNWLTVDQPLIDAFANVSGDNQWIHLDAERCQNESPYKTTIAHGFLTLSLLTQLHSQAVAVRAGQSRGINYGLNRVRFPSAVPSGIPSRPWA